MAQTAKDTGPALGVVARLIVGLVFAVGVACSIYAGGVAGMIVGLQKTAPELEEPRKGIGLAPDLSGVVDLFAGVGFGALVGGLAGLVVGVVLMWVLARWVLVPLVRRRIE